MGDAFDRVWDLSERRGLSLRGASLVAAIREVAAALDARGIYSLMAARVRDAMITRLVSATRARAPAPRERPRPSEVCASVSENGRPQWRRVTRKTLVREVVATGHN